QRIKEWDANVNHGYENSLKIITEYIIPACERILVQLDKLLGYSLWTQRYGDFLETSSIEKCIDQTQKFMTRVLQYAKAIKSLKKSFAVFIVWITTGNFSTIQKFYDSNSTEFDNPPVVCENPELVLQFLNKEFTNDIMAEYFSTSSSTEGIDFQIYERKLDIIDPILFCFSFNLEVERSLIQLLSSISDSCQRILEKPSTQVRITSVSPFCLSNVSLDFQPRKSIMSFTTVRDIIFI
ncbi:MAG: anaphase-promoting complex, cyclosome, subunit 4-domain-containing protein, partial [Benjaminiella poitrasii]